jgi:hypothetical protein
MAPHEDVNHGGGAIRHIDHGGSLPAPFRTRVSNPPPTRPAAACLN